MRTNANASLLFYGIIDLVPSSSTAAFSIIAAPDMLEIVRMTKTKGPRPRNTQDGCRDEVKKYACAIMGSVVSVAKVKDCQA